MEATARYEELLTVPEIAEYLKVSDLAVQKWCRDGALRAIKVGKLWRIRREDFERFIEPVEKEDSK